MLSSMDWNVAYAVSRALVLQVGDRGEILARASLSGRAEELDRGLLTVLLAFAGGRTPRRARAALGSGSDLDEAGFAEAVAALVARGALLPAAGDPAAIPRSARGFASAAIHYGMVRDTVRVLAFRRAIFRHCRDRTVVEIGCGSGILSIFAAQAGARRVIAIEESDIAELAAEMFRANGVADRIELRRANSRDVSLARPAEVLVHEVLGSDPFDEALLPSIDDARRRLLAPDGRPIPSALEVSCVGFEVADRPFFDRGQAAADLATLEGRYGIDFGPLRSALDADPGLFRRPLGNLGQEQFAPRILTDELPLYSLDFRPGAPFALEPRGGLRLRANRSGSLGGVLVCFRARLDEDEVLGTAPDLPRAPSWRWDARSLERLVAVEPGQEVPLRVELRTVRGIEGIHVALA
jgi:hypothetical protein